MNETEEKTLREALRSLGYLSGERTLADAAEEFRADFIREPNSIFEQIERSIISLILSVFFDTSIEEILAAEEELGRSSEYRSTEQYDSPNLRSRVQANNISGSSRERIAAMAESLVGQRESGGANRGAVVRMVMEGREGRDQLWCGGFTNFIMDNVDERLFDQRDFVSARSFEREAREHNAFQEKGNGYTPQVGDVVVFTRGGGGHVGIVTSVEGGRVTYVSGNDQNAVRERSFSIDNPPSNLLGYADIETLAENKNIDLDRSVETAHTHPSGLPAEMMAAVRNAGLSIAA